MAKAAAKTQVKAPAKAPAKKPVARSVDSLKKLLEQVNALAPKRSKASDGWIGDVKHMARHSDHNPEPDGTVDARDFTHDPSGGCDARKLCQAILDSKDPRLSYVISNGQIASGRKGPSPWVWRKYKGANGHYHHAHVSVLDEGQDDKSPWKIEKAFKKPEVVHATKEQISSVMHKGSKGEFVTTLQKDLNRAGYSVKIDGDFGDSTDTAVRAFQKDQGLDVDGWAGPETLTALAKKLERLRMKPVVERAQAKSEAAEKVVDEAARPGRGVSTTEVAAGASGLAGAATAVKEATDALRDSTASAWDLFASVGPWVLVALLIVAAAVYIYFERRRKRLEALEVQKKLAV